MAVAKKRKPATAETVNGLHNIERFGGRLYPHNSRELTDIQAERLARRFAISHDMAATIARLAYDAGVSR